MSQTLLFDISKSNYANHIITEKGKYIVPLGVLPGYNQIIDTQNYYFEKDLLHNFTFTDLIPVSYKLKVLKALYDFFTIGESPLDTVIAIGKTMIGNNEEALKKFKEGFHGALYEYSDTPHNIVNKNFVKALKNYFGSFFNENSQCILRLIGSQDSVYSETLQNRFGDNNIIDEVNGLTGGFKGLINSFLASSKNGKGGIIGTAVNTLFTVAQNLPKYNYELGINLMERLASSNSLADIFTKELLGLQISLPRVFENSDYVDSLNIFLRFTSPTGHDDDIKAYIITPLIILLTAAAPISFDGVTYGYPPLWQIRSYGNTFQTIGAIDVVTITRGSMETTYSDNLEPLSIDVRITMSSLNHHYATILMDKLTRSSLLKENGVGMTNAVSIEKGITSDFDTKPEIISINI
jgi:hypothetical protein